MRVASPLNNSSREFNGAGHVPVKFLAVDQHELATTDLLSLRVDRTAQYSEVVQSSREFHSDSCLQRVMPFAKLADHADGFLTGLPTALDDG